MEQSAFLDLVRVMYDRFLKCIEGLEAQNAVILEVREGIQ